MASFKSMSSAKRKKIIKTNLFVYSFLIIPLLHLAVFYFYVNIDSFFLAFERPSGQPLFYNFKRFLDTATYADSKLTEALGNTLRYFAQSIFIRFPMGIIIAYFLFKKICGYKFFRVMLFMPSIISSMVIVSLFKQVIAVDGPMLALLNKVFGLNFYPELLGNSEYATDTILFYCFWIGFGGDFMLVQGAMARVPEEVLEYAKLDGVKPFRELVSIILPTIFPTLSTLFILKFTVVFSSSGPILLFTEGAFKTFTIDYYIYDLTVNGGSAQQSLAAAVGLFFSVIATPIVFLVRWAANKLDTEVEY